MFRGCIPVLMLAAVLVQAQQDSAVVPAIGEVSIPAELTTTVRAERAHRGDPVEFRSLEAVLITNGLVMPANAKLMGRVVGAAARQGDKPSWLVLLVERAEWKQRSIPLHAFIARQIAISSANQPMPQNPNSLTGTTNPRRAGRESARAAGNDPIDGAASNKLPQDATTVAHRDSGAKAVPLKDLRMVQDKDGIEYLFSANSNVKLPSGALFVLQNQAGAEPAAPPK
jgi:hypothetical protein